MPNEIIDTGDISEDEYVQSNMVATHEPTGKGIEFHVSMQSWTQQDMEKLIVEAAARIVVGKIGDKRLAKMIEERCIALVAEKIDKHLASVTFDIIDQPIQPRYPFTKADEKPMTMREFIGLTGRDYMEVYVDSSGNPTTDRYGKKRVQHLVEGCLGLKYKNEIGKATNEAISEVQREVKARHEAFLNAEKARLREALAKLTGGES